MFLKRIILFLILSLICGNDLDPIDIINKSINRLNNIDIEFKSTIKQQSTISDPINYKLNFDVNNNLYQINYVLDNLNIIECYKLYNYIMFEKHLL